MATRMIVNRKVDVLRIENTNAFSFGVVTTGPIRVYWSDGSYTDVGVKTVRFDVTKNYSSIGNWNISIAGSENVKELFIDSSAHVGKINTNIIWVKQFNNLRALTLLNASFLGDLAPAIDDLKNLTYLRINYNYNRITFNVSGCKSFWKRCIYLYLNAPGGTSWVNGNTDDIDLNLGCTSFVWTTYSPNTGNFSGVTKNGYTALYSLTICSVGTTKKCFSLGSLENFIIPDTLRNIQLNNFSLGSWGNFNYKNLRRFGLGDIDFNPVDLDNNISFTEFGKIFESFVVYNGVGELKFDIRKLTSPNITNTSIQICTTVNKCYGDVSYLFSKLPNAQHFMFWRGMSDNSITGTVPENLPVAILSLDSIGVTITSSAIKNILNLNCTVMSLINMPNVTGDISGAYFKNGGSGWKHNISNLQNLYADITSFTFGGWYQTLYCGIQMSLNPHFNGNLINLALWANKQTIDLANCAYTGIPGFVRKVFANRNTCLKAAGGMTAISVQGNVDNNLLTGLFQKPSLGTYTGNMNDLTESQIDFLASGLDYTGTGVSTAWTDKEKIWFLVNCNNSSIDSSRRYRVTINY